MRYWSGFWKGGEEGLSDGKIEFRVAGATKWVVDWLFYYLASVWFLFWHPWLLDTIFCIIIYKNTGGTLFFFLSFLAALLAYF